MRVLLLYIDTGFGSRSLARSVACALRDRGAESQLVALHHLLPPWLNQALFDQYEQWCLRGAGAFKAIYRTPCFYPALYRAMPPMLRWRGNERSQHAYAAFSGHSVVVACSFYCAFFARWYASQFRLNVKVVGVLGDYAISPGWRLPLDLLFSSHDYDSAAMTWHRQRGVPILPLGIPTQLGPIITPGAWGHVLVAGGGWGLMPGFDPIATLVDMPEINGVMVACGRNQALAEALDNAYADQIESGRMIVLRAVDQLTAHYDRAQIVVTKAGGLTLTEAAIARRPMIVTGALPGHEQANLDVFKRNHALWLADTPQGLRRCITTILNAPEVVERRCAQAARLTNPHAARHIAQEMINLLR